jgi:hypothetical protein
MCVLVGHQVSSFMSHEMATRRLNPQTCSSKWMGKHDYDPEHGKGKPIQISPAATNQTGTVPPNNTPPLKLHHHSKHSVFALSITKFRETKPGQQIGSASSLKLILKERESVGVAQFPASSIALAH